MTMATSVARSPREGDTPVVSKSMVAMRSAGMAPYFRWRANGGLWPSSGEARR